MSTGAFNICCPRDCVSRHNGGTSGAPIMPRDAVSRTANVERTGRHKCVNYSRQKCRKILRKIPKFRRQFFLSNPTNRFKNSFRRTRERCCIFYLHLNKTDVRYATFCFLLSENHTGFQKNSDNCQIFISLNKFHDRYPFI